MNSSIMSWGINGFLIGIGAVFIVLLLLIVLISLMSKIINRKNKKEDISVKVALIEEIDAPAKTIDKDDDEIIAVIAAAIACMAQREGKKFKIRSYKRVR